MDLAGTVMSPVPVPAVGVGLAGVSSLRALVLVPAANPGGVGGEPREAGAGEAAHGVGTGRLYAAVGRAVEVGVVDVTLVDVDTLGLVEGGVTDDPGHTVVIVAAADLPVSTDSVELVAVSVAAVVGGGEAEPGGVVGVEREGEVLRIETEVVPAPGPARQETVLVSLTVALPLLAGVSSSIVIVNVIFNLIVIIVIIITILSSTSMLSSSSSSSSSSLSSSSSSSTP